MVHRAVPLLINIRMAALAALRFHEYLEGMLRHVWSARAGEKLPLRAVTSLSIVSGGISGLEMRFALFQATSRVHHVPAARPPTVASARQIPSRAGPRRHPAILLKRASTSPEKACQQRTT